MSFTIPAVWLTFCAYGFWIAKIKRRNPVEGLLYGLFLGPVGCVVEANLRERKAEEIEDERLRGQEEERIRQEAEKERQVVLQAERKRRRQLAEAEAEAARARRAEALGRLSEWFDRTILKFGWFKALPEVAQPIVIGLLVALPLVAVLVLVFGGR